jgi:subtilase family serine protease
MLAHDQRPRTASIAIRPEGVTETSPRSRLSRLAVRVSLGLAMLALLLSAASANTPKQGTVMGPEDESKTITVTVWLNMHNKSALDSLVEQMYDSTSPNFHHFLTMKEFKEQFAPSAEDAAAVSKFLKANNMTVTSTDKNNHFVVAQAKVGDAQKAFNTQINRVMVNGVMHRASTSEATVTPEVAPLVASVQGLSDLEYRAQVVRASDPETRIPYKGVPLTSVGPDGLFFSAECLRPPESVTFKTNGGFPAATYFGNRYGADITTATGDLPPCGYDAAELQQAYGLNSLYNHNLTGAGQTIMIVDAFGSNTLLQDANIFSELNGLPALTPANFSVFTPNGSATCTADNGCIAGNWQFETTLDVEWAHAIAPGANIVLVLSADDTLTNLDLGNLFAIENGFGNVLSNSFGISEIALVDFLPSELVVENGISEIAAALGISHDISSGDSGDQLATNNANYGINSVSVLTNADSPFATGVGGTSTFLDKKNNIKLQTGWGLNVALIADPTPNPPVIPPLFFGFQSGSGGGTSVVYAKPKFQRGLRGKFRQVPDISMNADPETGVEIIVTPDSIPGDEIDVAVFGGTSLACPMFSAFWAIANQANAAAGGGPLGQAAPILYQLSPNAITDVNINPLSTLLNVNGIVVNPPSPPTFESSPFLAQPLENTPPFGFISALFQSSTTAWAVFTFGTDSSLTTGPGWDNVTGLGTPNGLNFVNEVVRVAQRSGN